MKRRLLSFARAQRVLSYETTLAARALNRALHSSSRSLQELVEVGPSTSLNEAPKQPPRPLHAVISTQVLSIASDNCAGLTDSQFDLLSIGIGPSSSHTVGPMRAAKIFVEDLREADLLQQVKTLKVALYGSLAATGKGHMSVEALMMGFESEDCETIDTDTVVPRYEAIQKSKTLILGSTRQIDFDLSKDLTWYYDKSLPRHPNGMTFSVYGSDGSLIASNTYYSIGGGFVVNEATELQGENLYYKQIRKADADAARREPALKAVSASETAPAEAPVEKSVKAKSSEPPMLFSSAQSLLSLCEKNNMTIAQLVWENERHYYTDYEIKTKLLNLFNVMDQSIHSGVTSNEEYLPGGLRVKRRAKKLYTRLTRGLYANPPGASFVRPGSNEPIKPKRFSVPAMEVLTAYAIAVNEVNASGGRVVTAPTNGAAGVIPSVLKYFIEFISTPDEAERDVMTFLLTASAVGMLFKQGATISAAEGGCMSEGKFTETNIAGFAACLGASPSVIENAAEIAIEHNLGLTCDPIEGLVQVPCIERNALGNENLFQAAHIVDQLNMASGAVKAVTAASLAIAGEDAGTGAVTLDQAIAAMRETAEMMREELKETSRAGLARTSVRLPEC